MATYEVVDLSTEQVLVEARAEIDVESLRNQLEDIRDGIAPLLATEPEGQGIGLQEIEIALTVGGEGRIWFVAKGKVEASITLKFARPKAGGQA